VIVTGICCVFALLRQVDVRDTVGCGDSFASAIVLGYISGRSEQATLTLANAVGAATATGTGAGRNVASRAKVGPSVRFPMIGKALGQEWIAVCIGCLSLATACIAGTITMQVEQLLRLGLAQSPADMQPGGATSGQQLVEALDMLTAAQHAQHAAAV
jgi:hypothetical protein